jgi:predicted transcriptional regulator
MTRHLSVAALAALMLSLAPACSALQIGDQAPAFKLMDQFDKTWELAKLKDSVVVIVAADRDSGQMMAPWIDGLRPRYGGKIQLLGLMDLDGIPGMFRGMARSRIRKETKDPLVIDFEGSTGKAYEVSSKYPMVVVIDKTGVMRAIEKTHSKDAFTRVTDAIDKALGG